MADVQRLEQPHQRTGLDVAPQPAFGLQPLEQPEQRVPHRRPPGLGEAGPQVVLAESFGQQQPGERGCIGERVAARRQQRLVPGDNVVAMLGGSPTWKATSRSRVGGSATAGHGTGTTRCMSATRGEAPTPASGPMRMDCTFNAVPGGTRYGNRLLIGGTGGW
jgi:hypothetical protein